MAIKEITVFDVDGERFNTLQEAKAYEQREELIRYLMTNSDIDDRYQAGDVIDTLQRDYIITPKDQAA